MTNAPEEFDLAHELAETADWDDTATDKADGSIEIDGRLGDPDETSPDETTPDETSGEMDLAERYALRRVAGLNTELEDISEVEYRQLRLARGILVGGWTGGS